ncbi:MAG: amidohydrolase family protein [Deltaproteobacteria bacterium]|nr:amidohydrolase family protein [Deltaproteobacteria bacterium]
MLACNPLPPERLLIHAGRLFDGSGGPVLKNMQIEVYRGLIVNIKQDDHQIFSNSSNTKIIDAREATVMPGIINTQLDLTYNYQINEPGDFYTAIQNLNLFINSGITTVADRGTSLAMALGLRRYVGTGRGRGPRLLVSGSTIHTYEISNANLNDRSTVTCLATTKNENKKNIDTYQMQIRQLAVAGVDFINFTNVPKHSDATKSPQIIHDCWCNIIKEAHIQKLLAFVEVSNEQERTIANKCKADVIISKPNTNYLAYSDTATKKFHKQPDLVSILLHDKNIDTTSPNVALTTITRDSAKLLGLGDALGRIAIGYRADIIVVKGSPDSDLTKLKNIQMVIIDGIVQPTSESISTWWATISAAFYVIWAWIGI